MRQLIIVRKDLNMSPGKLAVQVAHASNAFLLAKIKAAANKEEWKSEADDKIWSVYKAELTFSPEVYEKWIDDIYTKTVCEAKNKDKLLKVLDTAKELSLKENIDYFIIKDYCLTELTPEEYDENGQGKVLTCIGFAPLDDETSHKLSKRYQLYK